MELGALLGELGDCPRPVVSLPTAPLLLPEAVPHGEVLGTLLLLSVDPLENVRSLFSLPGCGCIAGGGDCGPGALVVGEPCRDVATLTLPVPRSKGPFPTMSGTLVCVRVPLNSTLQSLAALSVTATLPAPIAGNDSRRAWTFAAEAL